MILRRCLIAIVLTLLPLGAWAEPVRVFAAASLKSALDEIVAGWSGDVLVSYGGSGTLAQQIRAGAPADIYLSASAAWMDVLVRDGLVDADARVDLLGNSLVLIAPVHAEISADPWADLEGSVLAMGQVDSVPAGIYGRQVLEALDLWSGALPGVLQTPSVQAALRLVALGEADYGIVYATDAAASDAVTIVAVIDPDLHDPVIYPMALIGPASVEAEAFADHLRGPEAAAIFEAYKFIVVARP